MCYQHSTEGYGSWWQIRHKRGCNDAEINQSSIMVPMNAYSSGKLCTLQDMASEICKDWSHSLYIVDAREIEEGEVFRDKDALKLSLFFLAI